tara:strand:+ start:335 stop:598 length:264 start_codon:yes stop_codon:yes gene_type:complete
MESALPDTGYTIRNRYALQAGTGIEGFLPDAGDAITDGDAPQASAASEESISDAGYTIRNRYTLQAGAGIEGTVADAGNAITNGDAT